MEENINQTNPLVMETTSSSVTPQPPFGSWWRVGGLVVGALVVATGLFFAGYQYSQKQTSPPIVPANNPTPMLTSTPDETTGWKTFNSKKGYILKYPRQFFEEKRVEGFFVFLENPQNKQNIAFYVDERGEKTIPERREETSKSLDKATFSGLGLTSVNGFIVDGTVKSEFGKGTYVKGAYIDLNGQELIFGCEGQFCKSDLFDKILSTFQF